MSRTQLRAKTGTTLADKEAGTFGEMETDSVFVKTQTNNTGKEETISFCEPAGTVAATGWGTEACFAAQQLILPPQPQSCFATLALGTNVHCAATCPNIRNRLQRSVSAIFTIYLSHVREFSAGHFLAFNCQFLPAVSA